MTRARVLMADLPAEWPLVLAIAIGAVVVAFAWAVQLPAFKPPDERAHADYAFVLSEVAAPFRVRDAHESYEPVSDQVRYLSRRVGFRPLRYNAYARVAPSYGSRAFQIALDEGAPVHPTVSIAAGSALPYVSFRYPAGYYIFVGAVLWAARHLTGSLWWSFMSARFANGVLLLGTVPLAYGALRESGVRTRAALVATAAIGFFPLVSWVGAYVQPDNLSLLLVTAAIYFALRLRSLPTRSIYPLAITIVALFFVKIHYACAVWIAVWILTATRSYPSRSRAISNVLAITLLPAAAFGFSLQASPGRIVAVQPMLNAGGNHVGVFFDGFLDEFAGGSGFKDYWIYDVRDLKLLGVGVSEAFVPSGAVASLAIFGLAATAFVRIAFRIARVARRRSPLTALRLLGSGVAVHAYVAVTVIVLWAYALSNGVLWLEGRYWLPVIVPLAIVMVAIVPTLVRAGRRRPLAQAIAFSMLAVSAVLAPIMFFAMERDYYQAPAGQLRADRMARIEEVVAGSRVYHEQSQIRVFKDDDSVILAGYAIDPVSGEAARRILVDVDGQRSTTGTDTEPTPGLASAYNDTAFERAGFRLSVDTHSLAPGYHRITLYVVTEGGVALEFGNRVSFTLERG